MTAHAERRAEPAGALAGGEALDSWLAALPDVIAHLEAAPHPRIADVGCGRGGRALAVARAFPHAWVDGFDPDRATIAAARRAAAEAGLDGHVRFVVGDAGRLAAEGVYDLVIVGEQRPATPGELRAVRAVLRRDACVLVARSEATAALAAASGFARAERVPVAGALYRLRP
jgi:predicted O-methyltransferase YrrM